MAWLSFTELDKAVVHVIRLASFARGVVRGHQRADTLKPYSQTSQSDHMDHSLV